MTKILQFFQDDTGALSSMRLTLIVWLVGGLAVWIYASIKSGTVCDIPSGVTATFGVLAAGKVGQSFSEKETK